MNGFLVILLCVLAALLIWLLIVALIFIIYLAGEKAKAKKFLRKFLAHPWYRRISEYIRREGMEIRFVPKIKANGPRECTNAIVGRNKISGKCEISCNARAMSKMPLEEVMLIIAHEIGHTEVEHFWRDICQKSGNGRIYCPIEEIAVFLAGVRVLKRVGFSVVISQEAFDCVPELASLLPPPVIGADKDRVIYFGREILEYISGSLFVPSACRKLRQCLEEQDAAGKLPGPRSSFRAVVLALKKTGLEKK